MSSPLPSSDEAPRREQLTALLAKTWHDDECAMIGSWDMTVPCDCDTRPELAALKALAAEALDSRERVATLEQERVAVVDIAEQYGTDAVDDLPGALSIMDGIIQDRDFTVTIERRAREQAESALASERSARESDREAFQTVMRQMPKPFDVVGDLREHYARRCCEFVERLRSASVSPIPESSNG